MKENVDRQFLELEKSSAQQQNILQEKLKETTALIEELKNLTAVKVSLEKMEKSAEKSANEQNKRLDTLINSISILTSEIKNGNSANIGLNNNSAMVVQKSLPKWVKVMIIVGGVLVCTTCLIVIAFLVLKVLKSYNLI